jgi:hypothetical protein
MAGALLASLPMHGKPGSVPRVAIHTLAVAAKPQGSEFF